MDYERIYKDALAKARHYYLTGKRGEPMDFIKIIFPELQESEDEKIRKELIKFVKVNIPNEERYIAWLEKQGEKQQKTSIWKHWKDGITGNGESEPIYLIKYGHTYSLSSCLGFECDYIELSELDNLLSEKQGEQRPTIEMITPEESLGIDSETYNKIVDKCIYGEQNPDDKVEPKFKIGDWIVDKSGLAQQVLDFRGGIYTCTYNSFTIGCESNYHLWTIQDAKPGDVIYLPNSNNEYYFFIFKGIENTAVMSFASFYQYDDGTSKVEGTIDNLCSVNDVFQPSTKEQRDILFSQIKEAGYEWDAEKKELRKIKQEPIWEWDAERSN